MVLEVLAAIENRPSRTHLVVLSDFDGTLTRFDVDPAAPTLSPETRSVLEALAARDDVTVGLVSGRRVDDLERRTKLPPLVYLAGLHGLEIRRDDHAWRHPDLIESRDLADRVAESIRHVVGDVAGLWLEHKGVAVTVHVRGVEPALREETLRKAREAARPWIAAGGFRPLEANLAFELLPNIAWTKGDAVRWIVSDVEQRIRARTWCVFFGDDVTDEEAFGAIDHGLAVVVGRRASHAHLRLSSPGDVEKVLARVNGRQEWRASDDVH